MQRTVGKVLAHEALRDDLRERLERTPGVPGQFATRLIGMVEGAVSFAEEVAASSEHERFCHEAAGRLYHAATAIRSTE